MSKARHARPSKARKAVTLAGTAAIPGITALAVASPAYAAPPSPQADHVPVPALIRVVSQASVPPLYMVRDGDSLSQIAKERCDGDTADWTGIYERNAGKISDPNLIYAGEQLVLDCRKAFIRPLVKTDAITVSQPAPQSAQHVNPGNYSGFQQCVITRESGGNSQVMNSTGHYGLYQFDYRTWVSGGGNPADFGHASVSEQNRVFANVYAQRGTEPWAPSDGC